ncbi:MAG: type II toxin-antitoxin system PemK/MazF family toxin [Candidatus Eremiobacterota bacterium]
MPWPRSGPSTWKRGRNTEGTGRLGDLNPVRGHEQSGIRPVVVLSEDGFNRLDSSRPRSPASPRR